MSKKILVTGGTGYVANYIILAMSKQYPKAQIIGMSRRGTARYPQIMAEYPNVEYVKGDCLEPATFTDVLKDVDGVVHTVGALVDNKRNPKLSYKAMNRDTCINMARVLNEHASED